MDGPSSQDESFGAKPDGEELPDHSWGLDRLGEFLRLQHEAIAQLERQSAASYWKLGQGLTLAFKQLGRSMRAPFLAELGIHKVRASKARAIYRRFPTIESIGTLTIEEAYAERHRPAASAEKTGRSRHRSDGSSKPSEPDELEQFLFDVAERADAFARAAALARADLRERLQSPIRQAIERLLRLERLLTTTADAERWDGPGEAN